MSVDTFKEYLKKNNIEIEVLETQEPTRTAQEAATTHNVPVSNIVKSLLVKVDDSFKMYLVPGDRKLDLSIIEGTDVRMANADEVKEITGYSIGGVPPFGHINNLETRIVEGFDGTKEILAAAGSSNSIFRTSLEDLKRYVLQG